MKFTRSGSVHLIAGVVVSAGAIVIACGGSEESPEVTPQGDGGASSSSGATSSSGGSSGTGSSSGSTTTDSGTDGGASDGGGDAGDGGAKKANGVGPCASGAECQSGECFVGKKESYCSIKCDMPNNDDPKCEALGGDFTGECNGQGYCKFDD